MLRFAANLAFMFTENPLPERFAAAAKVGFKAVELHAPYDQAAGALRAELDRHGLVMLGVNTRAGKTIGCAALAGCEAQFATEFEEALGYVSALGGSAIHCMAGILEGGSQREAMGVFAANLRHARRAAATQDRYARHG